MTTTEKTCNFNCTCVRTDCSYKHHLESLDDRKRFKELHERVYNKSVHNETDPDGCRHKTCVFGLLCNREGCGFKHFSNYQGRSLLIRQWYKEQRDKTKIDDAKRCMEIASKYNFDEDDKAWIERIKKDYIRIKEEKDEKEVDK
jgi:hypothetical protein